MSSFQAIRGKLEQATATALQGAGIQVVTFDNVHENEPSLPFASVSISFSNTIALSLGCAADQIEGSVAVTVATEKRTGSRAGEDALLAVLKAWVALNADFASQIRLRTRNHQGPVTFEPTNQRAEGLSHHIHTLNCGFGAAVQGQTPPPPPPSDPPLPPPPPPPPPAPPLLALDDGSLLVLDDGARVLLSP